MSGAEQALATLRDYVERSTHWQEGGADRHAAKLAIKALDDSIRGAVLDLTAGLDRVDSIRTGKLAEVTYETMQRSGFMRKNWVRKYTLADAKADASNAAIRLRNAWELLEPQ